MTPVEAEPSTRDRVVEQALRLMAADGVHAVSMRTLAAACDINVATLYHHFPSKADLVAAVVASRRYDDRLGDAEPPVQAGDPAADRLAALLVWMWAQMLAEGAMWRLLMGESLRGDPVIVGRAAELDAAFDRTLRGWLADVLPDVDPDRRDGLAAVLRGVSYAFCLERLAVDSTGTDDAVRAHAHTVATALFPPS